MLAEGNEFCVIEPDNNFLADCGFIGGSPAMVPMRSGTSRSEALGWPWSKTWDQETAIRSPHGGRKIRWRGGDPFDGGSPLCQDASMGAVVAWVRRVREVTSPKSWLSGMGQSRWIL